MVGLLKDSFNRDINYLRVSVTDRCNFRCFYCIPEEGVPFIPHNQILSYEETFRIIKVAVPIGIKKVRFTGGEPLLRLDFMDLIRMTRSIGGLEKISLTTNGIGLKKNARELREAGIDGLNISLNSLNPQKFTKITRGGRLEEVLEGVNASLEAGFDVVKINIIYLKGINDDEVKDFINLTKNPRIIVRFIELIPKGEARDIWLQHFALLKHLKDRLMNEGLLIYEEKCMVDGSGPSRYYPTPWGGKVGLIGLLSDHYCQNCNRLRLTSDGKLYPCLMNEEFVDLKPLLNIEEGDRLIEEAFFKAVKIKSLEACIEDPTFMNRIGG